MQDLINMNDEDLRLTYRQAVLLLSSPDNDESDILKHESWVLEVEEELMRRLARLRELEVFNRRVVLNARP